MTSTLRSPWPKRPKNGDAHQEHGHLPSGAGMWLKTMGCAKDVPMVMCVIPCVERGWGGGRREGGLAEPEPRFWPFLPLFKRPRRRRLRLVDLLLEDAFLLLEVRFDGRSLIGGAAGRLLGGGIRTNSQASLFVRQLLHGPV